MRPSSPIVFSENLQRLPTPRQGSGNIDSLVLISGHESALSGK